MSNDILDITKWEKEYPFLNMVSHVYNEFSRNEYDGTNKNLYDALCFTIINDAKEDVEKYKDICMKLMRNLGHLSEKPKDYELSSDRCNILFHWLYKFLGERKITYAIIDKCFEMYASDSLRKGNIKKKCLYFKDEKFVEPTKITLLDIFNDNMSIIKTTLMDQDLSISTPGIKYVCECVKIYKTMNETYCRNEVGKEKSYNSTCLKLKNFRQSYEHFYNVQGSTFHKIPSLNNGDSECLDILSSLQPKVSLALLHGEQGIPRYDKDLKEDDIDPDDPLSGRLDGPLVNGDSSMKKSITTTIGTVAGASSLLALLYKFSPGRNWIRSGLRGGRGRIHNNLYAGPSDLLYDGMEHNDFNSYSIGYEAM